IISEAKDVPSLFSVTFKSLSDFLQLEKCSLFLYDEDKKKLIVEYTLGLEGLENGREVEPEGILGYVFKAGDPLIISELESQKQFHPSILRDYKTDSFLCVPLVSGKKVIGILNLTDKFNGSPFDSFDFRIATTIVNLAMEAYYKILYQGEFIKGIMRKKELQTAGDLQESLLPKVFPHRQGLSIAAHFEPARVVGGDFFDTIEIDENRVGFVIGDVSGKGIIAALFMAVVKSVIKAQIEVTFLPKKSLRVSNQKIYEQAQNSMFVTVAYFVVDVYNSIIFYGSAGHNRQILYKYETDTVQF
ncbi:MAG: SpoIIE family protein phosphatase, partial [Actinomycetia bacterium]|nr:SpoIIE family protein phosphatase [Actinomycetes bacterium]